ncbi:hypothetical protein CONPUDRAFT_139327 [Coniophora puteana RWD-64-598 SS2]|uniref:DUF1275 domain protein n=1 Tax=Coniophora puteana (strain RWD-64-598) TaxID=741705 RepID=A0A5M3ME14_CONPW|nr:uncharacterized protein CONPUDRAFT_139327 [Coniophora puteana RWD-64-598 SS2]EIW77452.1 hypothetical protein CONPUDRAFT_139327 [Coniophora puteana RWD-64-598 SS2]
MPFLHQRTSSLKAEGIPLTPLRRSSYQRKALKKAARRRQRSSSAYSARLSVFDLDDHDENGDEGFDELLGHLDEVDLEDLSDDEPHSRTYHAQEHDEDGNALDDDDEFVGRYLQRRDPYRTEVGTSTSISLPKRYSMASQSVLPTSVVDEAGSMSSSTNQSSLERWKTHLYQDVDGEQSTFPLVAWCFMTGFINSITTSAVFVWAAFQTGNTIQLSLALARLFDGTHNYTFQLSDRFALCSILSFLGGAFIGRVGDKMGAKTRAWLALGSFIQTLFTMVAAIAIWKSGEPSVAVERGEIAWGSALSFVCVGFMSASMGLQGIMGKRINTQFTTTVVLTTTWCELVAEPTLFHVRRLVRTRDHKAIAIFACFLGGFAGRAILQAIGSAKTLGIGTVLRLLITVSWVFMPAKKK